MEPGLRARRSGLQPVGIRVTGQQGELEEEHAGAPNGGGTTEPGQDDLGDDGLDLKQQKGRNENRACVEDGAEPRGVAGRG